MYYFHYEVVREILDAAAAGRKRLKVSLDLNLSEKTVRIEDDQVILDEAWAVDAAQLKPVSSIKNRVFVLKPEGLVPVEIRANGYYKLVPTSTAPTLEINGIKMHRSKGIDPLEDARLKTDLVVKRGDHVLDTCGGLGYSALFAFKAGAGKVVSTEKSRQVMEIRALNPWLIGKEHKEIEWVHADIFDYIQGLKDRQFDAVIHDPPRFASATGQLYGQAFYDQLFRVMKPKAGLFHYTGSPKKIKHGDRFITNAMKRLSQVGFKKPVFREGLQGIHAFK